MLREEGGLQAKGNQLAILRQDVLAGRVASCQYAQLSQLGLERRLAAVMGSSVLAGRDSARSLVLQAKPLMQMVEQERRIASLALEQFMHYISPRDREVREMLVEWPEIGGAVGDLFVFLLPGLLIQQPLQHHH